MNAHPELEALTPKQRDFVLAYIETKNATEAAKRAGYSPATAYSIGQENLKKPEIDKAIESITRPILEEQFVTVKEVITELKEIGFDRSLPPKDRTVALKALGDHAGAWKETTTNVKHSGEVNFSLSNLFDRSLPSR